MRRAGSATDRRIEDRDERLAVLAVCAVCVVRDRTAVSRWSPFAAAVFVVAPGPDVPLCRGIVTRHHKM
jgi:hypothetical protein